jgi:hypothetical protein
MGRPVLGETFKLYASVPSMQAQGILSSRKPSESGLSLKHTVVRLSGGCGTFKRWGLVGHLQVMGTCPWIVE